MWSRGITNINVCKRMKNFEGNTGEADTRLSIEFPLSRARACFGGACGVDGHRDRAVRA